MRRWLVGLVLGGAGCSAAGSLEGEGLLLAFLVLPLASSLVPVLFLRRVPRRQRKMAWQLIVPLMAGVAMGIFGDAAGEEVALADRGVWTEAVVVRMDDSGTNHCDLRAVDGGEITPSLSEGDGCHDWVSKGDRLRVRYDPAGVASPTDDPHGGSDGAFLGTLFAVAVVMGTWGGVRQSRWDRAYHGR